MKLKHLTADWILPVSSCPIKNGAVVINDERILFVGDSSQASEKYPKAVKKYNPGKVILPGLVNPHTHLDFAHYRDQLAMGNSETMFDWIGRVIDLQPSTTLKMQRVGAHKGLKELKDTQTTLVGDIVHHPFIVDLLERRDFHGVCFHELSGFLPEAADNLFFKAQKTVNKVMGRAKKFKHFIAPHSPYAVSEELLQRISDLQLPTTFHLAESQDEVIFLKQGESRMKRIFKKLGKWNDHWKPPGVSPVRYFAALGLLHKKSIAVHMVATTEKDYPILEVTKPHICLCPRSNVWLNNGLPPAEDYLDLGLNVCLATDGLGSNHDLSMLNEMRFFKQRFPGIPDDTVVSMATWNGAKALGMDNYFGTLEPGKSTKMTILPNSDSSNPYAFLHEEE